MHFIANFVAGWDKYDLVWICLIIACWIYGYKMRTGGNGELRDFLHENGVKLLVLAVVVMLVIFAHHSAPVTAEAKFSDWCMAKAGEALACFFGLIQGAKPTAAPGQSTTRIETVTHEPIVPTPAADPKNMPLAK